MGWEVLVCEDCGTKNYVQRTSFGGETLDAEAFFARFPDLIGVEPERSRLPEWKAKQ